MKLLPPGAWLLCLLVLPHLLPAQSLPDPPSRTYDRAWQLYEEGLYEEAHRHFQRFMAAYPDDHRVPEAHYYAAESAFAAGDTTTAVALFQSFRNRYPAHPFYRDATLFLGTYYYDTGQYDRALSLLDEILTGQPSPMLAARALYWKAQAYRQLNRPEEAIATLKTLLERYGGTDIAPSALYALAYIYVQQDAFDEAVRTFEALIESYPDSPFARDIPLSLAESYYAIGNYRRAAELLEQHLPEFQGEAYERALFLLAESYNQLGDHSNAIVYYRRFVESYPNSPYYRHALYGLAWNYHFSGAYEWAANTFRQVWQNADDALAHQAMYYEAVNLKLAGQIEEAIKRFTAVAVRWPEGPLSDDALFERGMTYYELREWDRARTAFATLVEHYPDSELLGEAYRMLAETYVALGDFDRALEAYDRAIQLDTAPPELRRKVSFQKAWTLYRIEKFAEAAAAFHALYEANPDDEVAPDALFWAAESYYQIGKYPEAERLFRLYLKRFPNHTQVDAAHYALGWTYFKQQRYAEAAREFETFLRTYRTQDLLIPYRADARLRLADCYFALKQYGKAIAEYRKVKGSGEDYALYQIGKAYQHQGNVYQAVSHFRRLLEQFPDSPWSDKALFSIGYLYFLNQDYAQAIEHFQQLLETYPRSPLAPRALYLIGDAHYNAGDFEAAMTAYRQVLDRYPNSSFVIDAIAGIQYALVALGREAELDAVVDSFARQHPDSPLLDEVRFREAEIQFQNGNFERAIAEFQRFIRTARSPQLLSRAYLYLGRAYAELERFEEAEAYLKQVIERYPKHEESLEAGLRLGEIYLARERFEEALRLYQTLESRAREASLRAAIRYQQALALLRLNRTQEATGILEALIRERPSDEALYQRIRLALARAYEQEGRLSEALQFYRSVAEASRDETGAEALYRVGELLLRQQQPREALEELRRIPVLFAGFTDWVARSYLLQARIYRQLGQEGNAQQLYDRILREFPQTPFAEIARNEKQTR